MKKIVSVISVLILFSLIFSSCQRKETSSSEDIISVRVIELNKNKINKTVYASGQFTTEDETYLSFKTGGIVKDIYVNEGDAVKKGQIIASLELTEIEASVSQAKSAYEKALRDFNRVSNLYKDSVVTLTQFQDSKTLLDLATQQFSIAQYNLNHSKIRALFDGFILKKLVNQGQMVAPGMPIVQTNGAGKNNWVLKVSVSDNEWSSINLNDHAIIKTDTNSEELLQAFVNKKSEGIDAISGTFTVDLKITSNSKVKLASGLFGNAKIVLSKPQLFWIVPYESILDGDRNVGYAFVTNNYSTAQRVKVNIADILEDKVLINSGLENMKAIITSGSAYLTDNSKIKVAN